MLLKINLLHVLIIYIIFYEADWIDNPQIL
jgi:hypothetical protein